MTSTISTEAESDLRTLVSEWVQKHLRTKNLEAVEVLAEEVRTVVGQCIVETALLGVTGRATYAGTYQSCRCGGKARFVDYRARWVKTTCGEARIERAYYHCKQCKRGVVPWDEQQGLNERIWSPRLKALVCQVIGRLAYGEGVSLLEELKVVKLEISSAEEIAREVGESMRAEEARLLASHHRKQASLLSTQLFCSDEDPDASLPFPVREVSGKRLYIEVDAAKAHIDGDWHDVKVGTVFTVTSDRDGVDTPKDCSYVAAQQGAEEFGWKLRVRAEEHNLCGYEHAVFMADGAECLWRVAEERFPKATHVLDFYHAAEHVWALGRALYRQDEPKEKARGDRWIQERVDSLKTDGPVPLLRALKRRKVNTPEQREALRRETGYFVRNRERMNYPAYRAVGMMIGSGPIEAGCKVVVGQRLKHAGMRWSRAGADSILAIRTALLSSNVELIQQMARAA
jgi:hypothetical protein